MKVGWSRNMDKSFFVCGILRDVSKTFQQNYVRIASQLKGHGVNPHWYFYENDSRDNTVDILNKCAYDNENFHFDSEILDAKKWPTIAGAERARQMCKYRNHYMHRLHALDYDFDYTLIVDMDLPLLTLQGMEVALSYDADMVGCNGQAEKGRYYDTWALGGYPSKHHRAISEQEDKIAVTSCFGGAGLYKTSSLRDCWYDQGVQDAPNADHGTLHEAMIRKGRDRMFICPPWVVRY